MVSKINSCYAKKTRIKKSYNTIMKAIILARVSTEEQMNEGRSILSRFFMFEVVEIKNRSQQSFLDCRDFLLNTCHG